MGGRIIYAAAPDVEILAEAITRALPDRFGHIDLGRVYFVRSIGARTRAVARIHALPGIWRTVLGMPPQYIVEVVSENYDHLPCREKTRVIIHELLHIPGGFTGGLRPHGRLVNNRVVSRLLSVLEKRLGGGKALDNLCSRESFSI